jgi:hypothetical protein
MHCSLHAAAGAGTIECHGLDQALHVLIFAPQRLEVVALPIVVAKVVERLHLDQKLLKQGLIVDLHAHASTPRAEPAHPALILTSPAIR